MEQFRALCSISRLSNSSSLLSCTPYQTWLPFRRRPAVPATPRHKYPLSPEHFPSLSDPLSLASLSQRVSPSDSPILCFFSIHISRLPTPVKTYLFRCLVLCLCVSPLYFSVKFSTLLLNQVHLHTALSSITLSSHCFSFYFKLFRHLT